MELSREEREFAACSIFLPEEIVTKILLRLHIRPLFRFKCVSKLWNSIISDPKFGQYYMKRANSSPESRCSWHLWGMLYPFVSSAYDPPIQNCRFSSKSASTTLCESKTDDAPPSLYVSRFALCMKNYHIILASSNGLILSHLPPYYSSNGEWKADLCISNPLTKQSTRLPSLYFPTSKWAFGLATHAGQLGGDNPAYVTFKVVLIVEVHGAALVKIFSSDTGSWTHKELINCPPLHLCSDRTDAFTCKGILHWFVWGTRNIVTYDPYDSPDRFGCIRLPDGSDTILRNSGVNLIHLGDEDMMAFGDIEDSSTDHDQRMRVWRLVDHAKGEWRMERTCVVYPGYKESLLGSKWRKLVAPDPWNGELVCCLDTHYKGRFKAIDIGSAEEVFVGPSKGRTTATPSDDMNLLAPITVCPWSSPFYGGARSNSSSVVGFKKIPRVWFPSFVQ